MPQDRELSPDPSTHLCPGPQLGCCKGHTHLEVSLSAKCSPLFYFFIWYLYFLFSFSFWAFTLLNELSECRGSVPSRISPVLGSVVWMSASGVLMGLSRRAGPEPGAGPSWGSESPVANPTRQRGHGRGQDHCKDQPSHLTSAGCVIGLKFTVHALVGLLSPQFLSFN